jgi:molybdopterin-guanine dinucleotide biosynthesis protein A
MAELAPLFGLVLAGGRSRRMGRDKGTLRLDDETLRQRAARMLAVHAEQVFVSCRPDQVVDLEPGLQPLCDEAPDQGPLAGIAAAFGHRPDVAWLTMPCDMVGVDAEVLAALVLARRADQPAVAFRGEDGTGPEPLVAIWEPVMAPIIADALRREERSPRWLLTSVGCSLVTVPDPRALQNLNTPDAWEAYQRSRLNPD